MPHIHDKIDFCAEVYIVYKNKVLLRMHDKYDIWLGPGGHIELDEDPNQAAIREVKEEIGLDVVLYNDADYHMADRDGFKDLIRPQFLSRHMISENHEHVCLYYFATADSDIITPSETEKITEIRWFTMEELNNPKLEIMEEIRMYAKKALVTLSEKS